MQRADPLFSHILTPDILYNNSVLGRYFNFNGDSVVKIQNFQFQRRSVENLFIIKFEFNKISIFNFNFCNKYYRFIEFSIFWISTDSIFFLTWGRLVDTTSEQIASVKQTVA